MDLIIFMGQSNMQGETESLFENKPASNVYEYKFLTDSLVPVVNPVGEDISPDMKPTYQWSSEVNMDKWLSDNALLGAHKGRTNMVPSFVEEYNKVTNKEVVAVHAAKGSTVISYWLPETFGYNAVVTKTKSAIKKIGRENIEKIYAVWLQGESDMLNAKPKDEYYNDLIALKNGLKKDLEIEKFAVIRVGHFSVLADWCKQPENEREFNDMQVINAQEEAVKNDNDFIMLTRITDKMLYGDKKYLTPEVVGHFGTLGQIVLGKCAGHNLAAFRMGKPMKPDEDFLD